jgi:hypothetical protein
MPRFKALIPTAGFLLCFVPAHADTLTWTDPFGDFGSATATNDGSGDYTINTIMGTFNGYTISGLIGTSPGYGGNDNLLFCSVSGCLPDSSGIAFMTADGDSWRYFDDSGFTFVTDANGYYIYGTPVIYGCGYSGCPDYLDFTPSTAPSATPLPAALPLFGTVLAFGVVLGWRRERPMTHRSFWLALD